jgi:predicted DNA-binding transcriptional regulator AlpA
LFEGHELDKQTSPNIAGLRLLRLADLQRAGVVRSFAQLRVLIRDYGFPAGIKLSRNVRVYKQSDVEAWIATRPAADDTPLRGIVKERVENARGRR